MKKLNLILLVIAGTVACAAYAGEQREPLTPRTNALIQAIKHVRDTSSFYSERHARLLIELAGETEARLDGIKSDAAKAIAKQQEIIASIDGAKERLFATKSN
jgi:hypothetical protein